MSRKKRDKNPDTDYLVARPVDLCQERPGPTTAKLKKMVKDMREIYPDADLQVEEVLIVEDNAEASNKLKKILENQGLTLRFVKNAKEALNYLRDIKPLLVLIDISLPDMTGYELAQKIRSHPGLIHLPLVGATAESGPKTREHAELVGFDDLLELPCEDLEISNTIRSHLGMAPV